MKRNSLFTKLLAMMLCVMMVIGCLPLSALADANDWESEIDPADPIPGSEEAPIDLTADLLNENDFAATVTVPAGETYYYIAYRVGGMLMSINGGEAVEIVTDGMTSPYSWTITNDGAEDAEYVINVNYPEGTINNPQDLIVDETTTASLEASSEGWYFDFMAYENGYVTFTISGDSWQWQVTNNSTSVQDELYTSVVAEGEEVTNSLTYKYTAEEEYVIMVNTYNPEDAWNGPAGDISVTVEFKSGWGTEDSPYQLTELENYETIGANETVYYYGYFSGMNMTVSGNEGFVVNYNDTEYADTWGAIEPIAVVSDNPRMPIYFSVTNNNAEESGYYITFAYPEGTMNNPETLWENSTSSHTFAEGDGAWYYGYTGYSDGYLTFTISADCGWQYVINNITTGAYGDMQWSDSDPVVTTQTFTYYAGEEYVMEVATYNPADMWATPAGTINVEVTFVAGFGTEESPYMLNDQENDVTIADGDPVYYQGYFSGMNMTVTGEGDFSVIYNGETIEAVDGVVSIPVNSENPRMPILFAIDGSGDFSVDFTYPAGHMDNPAVAVLGDNTASVEAATQGYYWTYTAEKDGELNVTISGDDNWVYVVNNMTTYVYGETQWSDSNPVVNPTVIEVAAGDVIQIMMNGYDPDAWEAPAATLTINLAYTEEEVVLPDGNATLKFASVNLALNSDLSIGFTVKPEVFADGAYTDLRAEFKLVTSEGDIIADVTEFWVRNSDKRRVYDFNGIAPRMMGDTIYATLYGTFNGVEYSHTTEYAITTYCYSQLGKTDSAAFRTLLVDLLNFGAAHQAYAKYKTDTLVNASLTDTQKTYGTTTAPQYENLTNTSYATIDNPTASFKSVGLFLQKSVMINYKFVLPNTVSENYRVRFWLDDGTEWYIEQSEFVVADGYTDGRMSVDFGGLNAQQMAVPVYAALYDGETQISNTMLYSISSYYARQYNNDGSDLDNMLIAMIRYGDSAANYFA